jgi:HEAT repeat protein
VLSPDLLALVAEIRARREESVVRQEDIIAAARLWGAGETDDLQIEAWFEELADVPWNPPSWTELRLISDLGATPFGRRIAHFVEQAREDDSRLEIAAIAIGAARCTGEVETLSRLVESRGAGTCRAALKAVGDLQVTSLRPRVLLLASSPDVDIRAAALRALGGLRDRRDLKLLAEATRDDEAKIRAAALTGLSSFGADAPIPLLERMLDDPSPDCVVAAARALESVGSRSSAPRIAARAGNFPDGFVLQDVLETLDNEDAIPVLLELAERESGQSAEAAFQGIWRARGPEDVGRLVVMLDQPGRGRRLWAARALVQVLPPDFEDRVLGLLSDDDPGIRACAADACGIEGIRRSIPQLSSLLGSSNWSVRRAAVLALASLGDATIGPDVQKLLSSRDRQERNCGMSAAWLLGYPPAAVEIRQLLKSTESEEREWAANALGSCPETASVELLLSLRNDANPRLRSAAVTSLIDLGRLDDVRDWVCDTLPADWGYFTAPYGLLRKPDRAWALQAFLASLKTSRWPLGGRTLAHMDAALGGDWPEALELAFRRRLHILAARRDPNVARGATLELIKRGLIPQSNWRSVLEEVANVNPYYWGFKETVRAFGMALNPDTVRRLRRPELLSTDIANEDDFAKFLKSRGIEFDAGPFRIRGRFSAGREVSPLEIIANTENGFNDFAVVIERDLVRGMRTKDAAAYWRARLPR